MSIQEFLVWLSGGLGATMVASYIAERSSWFQALESNARKFYTALSASALAILAYLTYTYVPSDVWVALTPYWQLVLGVVAVNYGTEVFHWFDKKLVPDKAVG